MYWAVAEVQRIYECFRADQGAFSLEKLQFQPERAVDEYVDELLCQVDFAAADTGVGLPGPAVFCLERFELCLDLVLVPVSDGVSRVLRPSG